MLQTAEKQALRAGDIRGIRDRHGILTTGTCQYFKFVAFSVDFIILTERTEVPDDFRNYNNLQPNVSIAREALL